MPLLITAEEKKINHMCARGYIYTPLETMAWAFKYIYIYKKGGNRLMTGLEARLKLEQDKPKSYLVVADMGYPLYHSSHQLITVFEVLNPDICRKGLPPSS